MHTYKIKGNKKPNTSKLTQRHLILDQRFIRLFLQQICFRKWKLSGINSDITGETSERSGSVIYRFIYIYTHITFIKTGNKSAVKGSTHLLCSPIRNCIKVKTSSAWGEVEKWTTTRPSSVITQTTSASSFVQSQQNSSFFGFQEAIKRDCFLNLETKLFGPKCISFLQRCVHQRGFVNDPSFPLRADLEYNPRPIKLHWVSLQFWLIIYSQIICYFITKGSLGSFRPKTNPCDSCVQWQEHN